MIYWGCWVRELIFAENAELNARRFSQNNNSISIPKAGVRTRLFQENKHRTKVTLSKVGVRTNLFGLKLPQIYVANSPVLCRFSPA
jgi:hypothetical protein